MPVVPTAAQLLDQSQQTTEEWYKAVRTKKGYAGYVKVARSGSRSNGPSQLWMYLAAILLNPSQS